MFIQSDYGLALQLLGGFGQQLVLLPLKKINPYSSVCSTASP